MNRLAGTAISLPDQNALLSIRPDQLWSVRESAGRARFTRLDLATSGSNLAQPGPTLPDDPSRVVSAPSLD